MMNNPKLKPALIGGGVFGILSALPYIAFVNSACCALYIGGGVLAAYLHLKDAPATAKAPYGEGAVVGLLAGVFGAFAATLTTLAMAPFGIGEDQAAQVLAGLAQADIDVPPLVAEMMGSSGLSTIAVLSSLVLGIVLYSIFATIGGLLGAAIFRKKDEGPAA